MKRIVVMLLITLISTAALADIPFGTAQKGDATFYADIGDGACGAKINGSTEDFVSVSTEWWTALKNTNDDPLCKNVCIEVTYNGKTAKLPVKDRCQGCAKNRLELSKHHFIKWAAEGKGVIPITWKFVKC